jgi:adenylate kinase family enzyme
MMAGRKKKAVWIDKELEEELKEYILKNYNIKPDLLMTQICKQAIRFALKNAEEFGIFLLTGESIKRREKT